MTSKRNDPFRILPRELVGPVVYVEVWAHCAAEDWCLMAFRCVHMQDSGTGLAHIYTFTEVDPATRCLPSGRFASLKRHHFLRTLLRSTPIQDSSERDELEKERKEYKWRDPGYIWAKVVQRLPRSEVITVRQLETVHGLTSYQISALRQGVCALALTSVGPVLNHHLFSPHLSSFRSAAAATCGVPEPGCESSGGSAG